MAAKMLLIGGTRFLGLAIAEAFVGAGYEVYEMNRGSKPSAKGVNERIVCDKTDRPAFAAVLKRRRWDAIVDTMLNDEDLKFVIDTIGSDVGHFIHTGSLGVYGAAREFPALESTPLREYENDAIVFNYKIRQDQVLTRAFQERAFPATILRMSNIYGAGDIPLDGWGGRSPEFFHLLRDGGKILLANDGRALLHPGHVKDLGRAFLHAAKRPESIGQIYNVGGPCALMMKDYVTALAAAMDVRADLAFAPIPEVLAKFPKIAGEHGMKFAAQHMCASIAKAEKDLNWRPEISLEVGLRENIEWMRQRKIV